MNKEFKSAEEFASNESFQDYCLEKSARSKRKWQRYLAKNASKRDLIDEAKMLVLLFHPGEQVSSKQTLMKRITGIRFFMKACAVLIVISSISFIAYNYSTSQVEFSIISKMAEGQNQSILLSDLTNVELRKNSTLSFKESWENSPSRTVELKGEAYFDVQKSLIDGKPFEVNLDNGVISVLGTRFLVKSTPSQCQIILEEGKIVYQVAGKEYELNPGDVLMYNEEMVSIHHKKEITTYDSWRKHELVFQNTPIEKVISTINNSYNLKVSIGSEGLKNKKITTTVYQNDPILLLQSIAAIYEMDIDIQEPKIVLK